MITKTERAGLERLIRQRFRVLRSEIEQRRAELLAELEQRIGEHYANDEGAGKDELRRAGRAKVDATVKAAEVRSGTRRSIALSRRGSSRHEPMRTVTLTDLTRRQSTANRVAHAHRAIQGIEEALRDTLDITQPSQELHDTTARLVEALREWRLSLRTALDTERAGTRP